MKRSRSYTANGRPPTMYACGQTYIGRVQLYLRVLLVLQLLSPCLYAAMGRASKSEARDRQTRSTRESHPDRRLAALQSEADRLQKEILRTAQQLVSDFPGNEEPLTLMGIVYHGMGKDNLALEYWGKALAINPRQPDVFYNMGLVAMQQEDYNKAISSWQEALQINPKMAGANLAIGRALLALGKQEQAIDAFAKELDLTPDSVQSHYMLGQAHAQTENYEKAKQHYLKVVESEPNYGDAYYGLFQACSRLGQKELARKYITRFRQLKSHTHDRGRDLDTSLELARVRASATRLYLGVSELYIGNGKYDRAENVLKEALAIDPNQVTCLKKLTTLYRRTGRLEAALKTCRRVTVLEPNNPQGFLVMGTLASQLNRYDQAEPALRRVIELAPQAAVGYRELARLYLKANRNTAQARVYAQKAVELQQRAENYFILSLACVRGGDKHAALVAMREAMKHAPDNTLYRKMYDQIRSQP